MFLAFLCRTVASGINLALEKKLNETGLRLRAKSGLHLEYHLSKASTTTGWMGSWRFAGQLPLRFQRSFPKPRRFHWCKASDLSFMELVAGCSCSEVGCGFSPASWLQADGDRRGDACYAYPSQLCSSGLNTNGQASDSEDEPPKTEKASGLHLALPRIQPVDCGAFRARSRALRLKRRSSLAKISGWARE